MSKKRLRIGCRPGWPGSSVQDYVTHAVYQVRGQDNNSWGPVKGYGKQAGQGAIINDATANPGATYTWYEPTLILGSEYVDLFEAEVLQSAQGLYYTGVGGNCYSPIIKGLEAVEGELQRRHASGHLATDVGRVLQQLLGSNYCMGTRITNTKLAAGFALFVIYNAVSWYRRVGV